MSLTAAMTIVKAKYQFAIQEAWSVMQNRLASAGLWGLRERSVQVSGQQPQRVLCITRTFE
jgi:hypothetical protein